MPFASTNTNESRDKTGKKDATCFATLLQNEFNGNVACFTTHWLKLSFNKSGCSKICTWYVARFTGPKQTCFTASDVNPVYGVTPTKFYPIRSQYSTTCKNLICCKTGLNVGGKTCNVAFHLPGPCSAFSRPSRSMRYRTIPGSTWPETHWPRGRVIRTGQAFQPVLQQCCKTSCTLFFFARFTVPSQG